MAINSVTTEGSDGIRDGSVTEDKIAEGAIKTEHLSADLELPSGNIEADAVGNDALAPSALKSYKFTYDFSVQGGVHTRDEVQTLTIDATGGTFTAAWDGGTASSALAEDISSADLQTALRALDADLAAVTVSGDGPHVITFAGGNVGSQPIGLERLIIDDAELTGGSGAAIVVTTAGNTGAKVLTAADGQLPDNFVIKDVLQHTKTALTSGGAATVALGITGNADALVAATAYTDNSFDVADQCTARTNEIPLITSAASDVIATIADASLTAGKFELFVSGFEGL